MVPGGVILIVLGVFGVLSVRKMPRGSRRGDGGVTSDGYHGLMIILGALIVVGTVAVAFGLAIAWGD